MEQLQHHGITGTVPKHVLSDNMKTLQLSTVRTMDDGFIHLSARKGMYFLSEQFVP